VKGGIDFVTGNLEEAPQWPAGSNRCLQQVDDAADILVEQFVVGVGRPQHRGREIGDDSPPSTAAATHHDW